MMELFLLLFVIQGDTSGEWMQSCYDEFDPNMDYFLPLRGFDPSNQTHVDSVFCRTVLDLYLDQYDLEKLGRNLDWSNYVIQTTTEFLDNYDFYREYGIKDTLEIKPIIGLRDLNPRDMKVVISFDYLDGISIYYYEEIFGVHPLCDPPISYDGVCNLKATLDASPTSITRDSDFITHGPNMPIEEPDSILQDVLDNCSCQESGQDCIEPELRWWNATHYIDNIDCEYLDRYSFGAPPEPEPPTITHTQQQMIEEYCKTGIRHPDMRGIPQCIKNEPICDPGSELINGVCNLVVTDFLTSEDHNGMGGFILIGIPAIIAIIIISVIGYKKYKK